jgi:ABC-2 type transport system permease protein
MRARNIKALLGMNARELLRDFGAVFISFAFPLFFVVTLGVTDGMRQPFTFEVGVVDKQTTEQSDRLIHAVESTGFVHTRRLDLDTGKRALKDGDVHMLMLIPEGDLGTGDAVVTAVVDPGFSAFAAMVVETGRSGVAAGEAGYRHPFQISVEAPSLRPRSEFSFVFPGILAIALLQLGLFATATPLLRARDRGTLRHLGTTPVTRTEMIVAQLILRLIVGTAQLCLLLGLAVFVFDVRIAGSAPSLLGTALLGTVMLVAIGYALAGVMPTVETGMKVVMLANFAMIFGGNVFWSLSDAPGPVRYVMYALPLTYLSDMFRQIVSGLSGVFPLWIDAAVVAGIALAAIAVASRTFRFDMERC